MPEAERETNFELTSILNYFESAVKKAREEYEETSQLKDETIAGLENWIHNLQKSGYDFEEMGQKIEEGEVDGQLETLLELLRKTSQLLELVNAASAKEKVDQEEIETKTASETRVEITRIFREFKGDSSSLIKLAQTLSPQVVQQRLISLQQLYDRAEALLPQLTNQGEKNLAERQLEQMQQNLEELKKVADPEQRQQEQVGEALKLLDERAAELSDFIDQEELADYMTGSESELDPFSEYQRGDSYYVWLLKSIRNLASLQTDVSQEIEKIDNFVKKNEYKTELADKNYAYILDRARKLRRSFVEHTLSKQVTQIKKLITPAMERGYSLPVIEREDGEDINLAEQLDNITEGLQAQARAIQAVSHIGQAEQDLELVQHRLKTAEELIVAVEKATQEHEKYESLVTDVFDIIDGHLNNLVDEDGQRTDSLNKLVEEQNIELLSQEYQWLKTEQKKLDDLSESLSSEEGVERESASFLEIKKTLQFLDRVKRKLDQALKEAFLLQLAEPQNTSRGRVPMYDYESFPEGDGILSKILAISIEDVKQDSSETPHLESLQRCLNESVNHFKNKNLLGDLTQANYPENEARGLEVYKERDQINELIAKAQDYIEKAIMASKEDAEAVKARRKLEKLFANLMQTETPTKGVESIGKGQDLADEIRTEVERLEDDAEKEVWEAKLAIWDGFIKGAGEDAFQELALSETKKNMKKIAGVVSLDDMRLFMETEYLDLPVSAKELVDFTEKLFLEGSMEYVDADGNPMTHPKTGDQMVDNDGEPLKHNYARSGNPKSGEVDSGKKLKFIDFLRLRFPGALESDLQTVRFLTIISHLRQKGNVPYYAGYVETPTTLDMRPIEIAAPFAYFMYKIRSGNFARPEWLEVAQSLSLPKEPHSEIPTEVIYEETGERVREYIGTPDNIPRATDNVKGYLEETRRIHDLLLTSADFDRVEVGWDYQIMPMIWDLIRDPSYKNITIAKYQNAAEEWLHFVHMMTYPTKPSSKSDIDDSLAEGVTAFSKVKGIYNIVKHDNKYGPIFEGLVQQLLLRYTKDIWDSTNKNMNLPTEILKLFFFVRRAKAAILPPGTVPDFIKDFFFNKDKTGVLDLVTALPGIHSTFMGPDTKKYKLLFSSTRPLNIVRKASRNETYQQQTREPTESEKEDVE